MEKEDGKMHIVLHEPEIPGNTGNIGRSCAATNTSLHLIEPLGFEITEKELRRAGLDYWSQLDVHAAIRIMRTFCWKFGSISYHSDKSNDKEDGEKDGEREKNCPDSSLNIPENANKGDSHNRGDVKKRPPRIWFATTKAKKLYCDADFGPDDYIMFGKESAGIPEEILVENEAACIRIPMGYGIRSLNLSNAVAVVLYEALRRNGFPGA